MLEFFKKLFGAKPVETPAPYNVEAPKAEDFNFPVEKPVKSKKPTIKKATTAKPKKPKTPKA